VSKKKFSVAIVTSIHPDYDKRVWRHALSLSKYGIKVYLICPWNVKKGESEKYDNIVFLPFKRNFFRPLNSLSILKEIYSHFREIDIIHFHDLDILLSMSAVSFFKPVVYDIHENYHEEMLNKERIPSKLRLPISKIVKILGYLFAKKIKNLVFVVPSQSEDYPKSSNKVLIRNFASLSLASNFKDNYLCRENKILFTGSMYETNGCFLLLDIAEKMLERGVDAKIVVTDRFSSTKIKSKFINKIYEKNLTNISIIQPVLPDQIMELLNTSTIGISPNLRVLKQELALPTKIFEYMAAGIPQVASDLFFIKKYITKDTGILANPDLPETFIDAICLLIRDREKAYKIGMNAREKFLNEYNWEAEIKKLIPYYENILKNNRQ
jgi:glycosyltransferase involved in cell wall biosynthesis